MVSKGVFNIRGKGLQTKNPSNFGPNSFPSSRQNLDTTSGHLGLKPSASRYKYDVVIITVI
jgi:hypothetical protein